jgi:ketosteroid isomerase-like protein
MDANNDQTRALRELMNRQIIRDLVYTYCRAVDRFDRELLLSVYHDDAIDDHGMVVAGPEKFADWVFTFHGRFQQRTQHIITNHLCEIEGDIAHAESYWMLAAVNAGGPHLSFGGGRYVDRFERRDGRWAIAARKCLLDWSGTPEAMPLPQEALDAFQATGVPSRDRNDPSYQRPLGVDPKRVGFVFGESL